MTPRDTVAAIDARLAELAAEDREATRQELIAALDAGQELTGDQWRRWHAVAAADLEDAWRLPAGAWTAAAGAYVEALFDASGVADPEMGTDCLPDGSMWVPASVADPKKGIYANPDSSLWVTSRSRGPVCLGTWDARAIATAERAELLRARAERDAAGGPPRGAGLTVDEIRRTLRDWSYGWPPPQAELTGYTPRQVYNVLRAAGTTWRAEIAAAEAERNR